MVVEIKTFTVNLEKELLVVGKRAGALAKQGHHQADDMRALAQSLAVLGAADGGYLGEAVLQVSELNDRLQVVLFYRL